jgi:hypothetical protein
VVLVAEREGSRTSRAVPETAPLMPWSWAPDDRPDPLDPDYDPTVDEQDLDFADDAVIAQIIGEPRPFTRKAEERIHD